MLIKNINIISRKQESSDVARGSHMRERYSISVRKEYFRFAASKHRAGSSEGLQTAARWTLHLLQYTLCNRTDRLSKVPGKKLIKPNRQASGP